MSRLLGPRDKLLLGLAVIEEVFGEVRTVGGLVGSAYQTCYGYFPDKYKKANYYGLVSKLLKSGLIEKIVEGGKPYLKITSKGSRKISRKFPLIELQNKKWDGLFRILIFDIPEINKSKREHLRSKIKELGFGMIQKSVWISAYPFEDDIRDFLESENLDEFALIFVAKSLCRESSVQIAIKIWNLENIHEMYLDAISEYKEGNLDGFMKTYLNILHIDPFLPKQLLPKDWLGFDAREIFKKVQRKI